MKLNKELQNLLEKNLNLSDKKMKQLLKKINLLLINRHHMKRK